MKSFKSYEKYLNSKGYFISDGLCYDILNGILEFVTFDNKEKGLSLQLRTVPNKKYAAKLAMLHDGDEVEINFLLIINICLIPTTVQIHGKKY